MTAPAVPRETKAVARPPRPVASLDDILLELVDIDDNVRDDVGDLSELQASISELGLLSPVKVTAQPTGRYRLVYGQRRVLACRALGRVKISAIVEPASDVDQVGARRSIEQLAENLQRKDLNPIEEAVALREVLDADPTLTQEALADQLAMSRPWVSNTLGLLEAAPAVQEHIRAGRLTASHAKAVRGLSPKVQAELADEAVERGYSAHAFEEGVQRWKSNEGWKKEAAQRSRAEAEQQRSRQAAAVAKLVKSTGLDTPIYVGGGYYAKDHIGPVVKLLAEAGFTKVVEKAAVGSRPKKGDVCDCTAWKVDIGYGGSLSIAAACVVQKHQDAVYNAERAAEAAARQYQDRIKGAVQAYVTEQALHVKPGFKTSHPGAEVSFDTPDRGRLVFHTDAFGTLQANLRAISNGLEALRAVDRYGITSGNEQYAGFAQIGPGGGDPVRGKLLVDAAGTVRKALTAAHPDHGGTVRDLADVQAYRTAAGPR